MTEVQKHIRCLPGDVAKYVLLPGDPARSERIAAAMDSSHHVSQNREYNIFTGETGGVPVSVCSTGIGGPSAAIALEELHKVGAEVFIRVGSAGGRQKQISVGSLVVVTAAYRGEGTSNAYLPPEFPAVADLGVTNALVQAAQELNYESYTGIAASRDAFYIRDAQLNETLNQAGVVAAEMEAATLFIAGTWRGVRVGCVLGTDSNIYLETQPTLTEKEARYADAEKKAIATALRAVQIMERSHA